MKCIHHDDQDGLCAAAIVRFYLKDKVEEPSDFIMWRHGQELNLPEKLNEGETWYIVDLAMDDVIYNAICTLVEAGCKVVHIDHHKSGIDYHDRLPAESKAKIEAVVKYYDTAVSGCMLTFLYAQMNDEDRKNPDSVEIELSPNHAKYAFTNKTPVEVGDIPFVVRYVDDWDVQTGILPDSVPFHYGFADETEKNPCDDIWMHLFTQERFTIGPIIQKGNAFTSIYEKDNIRGIKNGFECTINGIKCFATNSTAGDCRMFNTIRDQYPMFCKYSYDGSIHKWRYFLVSGQDGSVDVSEVARSFGGGGHAAAAGCQTDDLIFDK